MVEREGEVEAARGREAAARERAILKKLKEEAHMKTVEKLNKKTVILAAVIIL